MKSTHKSKINWLEVFYFLIALLIAVSFLLSATFLLGFSTINYFENSFQKKYTAQFSDLRQALISENQDLYQKLDDLHNRYLKLSQDHKNKTEKVEELEVSIKYLQDVEAILQDKISIISEIKLRPENDSRLYVVVNTEENTLQLRRGQTTLNTFKVGTGFKRDLYDPNSQVTRNISITPKRAMKVSRLAKNPIWIKPDWFFIENNLPIPPLDSPLRKDKYSLGPFGIYLEDRYIIHGALSKKDLGQNVSHGCIRMQSKDLKVVFDNVKIGTEVFIY